LAYQPQHAAYDLKKLRAKGLIGKVGSSRRYQVPPDGLRTIAALMILRDQVIKPILVGTCRPCSRTWISQHRQLFVDVAMTST